MPASFHRVNQSLRSDNGFRSLTTLVVAVALLAAWITWALTARVTRYEVAGSARLEADGAAYPIQSNVAGRIVSTNLVLGREVQAGDILAEVDSEDQRLSLQQEQTHLASLAPQLAALRSESQAVNEGGSDERQVLSLSIDGARLQYREAQAQADFAAQDALRAERLHSAGILSDADAQRAEADAQSKRDSAANLKVSISRLAPRAERSRARPRSAPEICSGRYRQARGGSGQLFGGHSPPRI